MRHLSLATFGLIVTLATLPASAAPDETAVRALLERVIGSSAAQQVSLTLVPVSNGPGGAIEEFTISGAPGRIAIQANSPSALTQGAGWYLKYVAHADLMLRGSRPVLPAQLPAPPAVIRKTASVPNRFALNDTNDSYTDPHLAWEGWENELDLMALHGINQVYITTGTGYVYYQLLQKYGYAADEVRRLIPDPAHEPFFISQNMFGGDFPVTEALLIKRAALGRRIADRARELGMVPVFPGYWGNVPLDFASRNPGADVIAQDTWVGYQRPSWLNPATPLFDQLAADYYALSEQVLGRSTMYKMDPLQEGGVLGHIDLTQAAAALDGALQAARPGATWVILAWMVNPLPALLNGVADKSRMLLLASEADKFPQWDSAMRWGDVPYAFGSIYNGGGRTIIGANLTTIVDRWYSDLHGPNAARLRGIAIFPESWTANPMAAELMSELPWQPSRFELQDWARDYAAGRYGTNDAHALAAWSTFAQTAYAAPPDGESEGQDSLFNAQPSLTATTVLWCCNYGRMRYSGPDFERGWRELASAAPSITQDAAYQFDLTDATRQVIVNRARVVLPRIRHAYDTRDTASFERLTARWLRLMDLADQVEATHAAFMLGPHLDTARAIASTPQEAAQLVRNAVNLITNWGIEAGFNSGLRDYAHRDWNCLTSTYYKPRWMLFFASLRKELAGQAADPVDWYRYGDDYASADHSACASSPTGDIVSLAGQVALVLAESDDGSNVPDGWWSYAENDASFDSNAAGGFSITSSGTDVWRNINRYGLVYRRGALRDGGSVTVRVTSMRTDVDLPWARAGLMAGGNLVSSHPGGFVNIALTPDHGCVFSWARDANAGLADYTASAVTTGAGWVRLARVGDTYVGSCSSDGDNWTIVGSAVPGDIETTADVGMFASAVNGGGSDRLVASFDRWNPTAGASSAGKQVAIEYFHAGFGHHFITSITDEIAKLDAGVFSGWARTGLGFNVDVVPGAGRVPVCRFFTVAFPPTSSHFYAPRGLGCEAAMANADWQFEGEVFYSALPAANGDCPAGYAPIYRLYNDGQGGAPNHRFTTSAAVRAQMVSAGYTPEGRGIGVGMCSPE